ncbi:MAG: YfhO family protein [Caldilineaceae bacterium]
MRDRLLPCLSALLVGSVLAIFIALLYYPLLFTNRVLASGDILLYFYPYRDYAAAALRAGHIPLWNPYIFNGVPFLANPQAAVLYPLHWPLSWLPVTKQIYWSAALHTWLLGFGGYLFARQLRLPVWGGLTTALVLAGSGFYGGLIGHLNQMNGAAWLPWALLILSDANVDAAARCAPWRLRSRHLLPRIAAFAFIGAMMVLAGHTQTAYINLFGIGLWLVWRAAMRLPDWQISSHNSRHFLSALGPPLLIYGGGLLLAMLLCAAQLLPTLELSGLGLRSGGLSYGEVSSFSLRPTRLPWTLLPTYGLIELGPIFGAGYTEFIGYVGAVGLALAALGIWRGRGPVRATGLFFSILGLFLALGRWNPAYYLLYKLAPGFDLFRVPARWMMLYTLGMALLAGLGIAWLAEKSKEAQRAGRFTRSLISRTQRAPGENEIRFPWQNFRFSHGSPMRLARFPGSALAGILLLLAIDLLLAARALPHTQPTAPQAVYGVRTAPAHLLTDPVRQSVGPAAMGRFLGMSTIAYDPGDMADWRQVLLERDPPQLDEAAFEQFIIGLKMQELLVPNLPLFWRIPAVDGFDGGVLPLQRYNKFLTLFVPPDRLVPDGRLREQIQEVPSADLLGLLNVQYVITDKVRDLWYDNVYYDRQIGARLTAEHPVVTMAVPEPFSATHLDLIGYIADSASTVTGQARVAGVTVYDGDGPADELNISAGDAAGIDLAGPQLDNPTAAKAGLTVAFRDVERGVQEYRVRLPFVQPTTPTTITVTLADQSLPLTIQAATLFDARTQMFSPLLPSDRGRFRLVHSGDVKIYENVDVRPRAYLVHRVYATADADMALTLIRDDAAIRQGEAAVIEDPTANADGAVPALQLETNAQPGDQVEILSYEAEALTMRVATAEPALLVVSDTNFPGWQATVDGSETELTTANVLFRGVQVPAGEHIVTLRYQPASWRWGLRGTFLGIVIELGIVLWWAATRMQRTHARAQERRQEQS